jgi:hypothetical protein
MARFHFISYSAVDGLDFALRLFDALAAVDTDGILRDVRAAASGN